MTNNKMPDIGNKLEIELMYSNIKERLISQVIDIVSDKTLLIGIPISKGNIIPISIRDEINLTYNKKNIANYGFKAKVIDRGSKAGVFYLKVQRVSDINKIQRRDYFRLDIVLNVEVNVKNDSNEILGQIHALSKDISGGGLKLISKEPIKKGLKVDVVIKGKDKIINIDAKVLRCVLDEEVEGKYEIGLKYGDKNVNAREDIVKFIFDEQRKMRKKGLI